MKKIIVVGGGAAGMIAAIAAAEAGAEVSLYEKNEKLGKKIYITGKGRCNVTNDCATEDFFGNVISNPKFMYSAFYSYDNTRIMELITEAGCELKVERGNRVFPLSDHSSDIISTLSRKMKTLGVEVFLNKDVKGLVIEDGVCKGIILGKEKIIADAVIVTTGGLSYPTTGSTGDGIKWAKECGHKIVDCAPSLVPFNIKEGWVKELQGLSLKNVGLKLVCSGKTIYDGFGEMLFTHFGVSGPLVLSASSFYSLYISKHPECKNAKIYLDIKSALDREQLDKRIIRDFEKYNNKMFKNSIGDMLPSKMIPVIIKLSGINPDKPVNLITKEERAVLVDLLKNLELNVASLRGFAEAIITRGGVAVKDINPSTMESKVVSDLYFAGEMIDVDALTGGFNLQIAWSTGHLAGESAAYK